MHLTLSVEIDGGTPLRKAIEEAIILAQRLDLAVEFAFNGVGMTVLPTSTIDQWADYYERMLERAAIPKSPLELHQEAAARLAKDEQLKKKKKVGV